MTQTANNKSSAELANMFLRGRASAWLSAKQTKWLVDVLSQERKDDVVHREYLLNTDQVNRDPHGYTLNIAPNQASLLKPVPCLGSECRVCAAKSRALAEDSFSRIEGSIAAQDAHARKFA